MGVRPQGTVPGLQEAFLGQADPFLTARGRGQGSEPGVGEATGKGSRVSSWRGLAASGDLGGAVENKAWFWQPHESPLVHCAQRCPPQLSPGKPV